MGTLLTDPAVRTLYVRLLPWTIAHVTKASKEHSGNFFIMIWILYNCGFFRVRT
jgi:hypothetical protein